MNLLLLTILLSETKAYIFSPIWISQKIANFTGTTDNRSKGYHSTQTNTVCETQGCKLAAESLLRHMNQSADPCSDFYEFACGGWLQANPIPPTEASWGQFDIVSDKNYHETKKILEADVDLNDPEPITAMKIIYQACLNKDLTDSKQNIKPLLDMTMSLGGGWPMVYGQKWSDNNFVWYEVVADIISNLYSSSLMSVFVANDRKNTSSYAITIDQPSFVLSREMLLKPTTYKRHIEAYRSHMVGVAWIIAKAVGSSHVTKSDIIREVDEMLEFETKLSRLVSSQEMRRNVLRTYNPMTLRSLQDFSDSSAPNQINWLKFMKRLTSDFDFHLDWSERVIVRETDFIFNLMKLIQRTPSRTIANFMQWGIVRYFAHELSSSLRHLTFEFDRVLTGVTNEQPIWKECVGTVHASLSMALGYSYVQKHFDNSAKIAAEEMSDNIRSVFSEELGRLDWMDEGTKERARHKVAAMTSLIGYPAWFSNTSALEKFYEGLQVSKNHFDNLSSTLRFKFLKNFRRYKKPADRNEWATSPAEVNAFYNPSQNAIIFPAAILQPPFFTKGRIQALNYGGIGVIIGHEITHAFDDVGRQFDAEGNLAQWWSEETIQTYLEKSACFVSQYGGYKLNELSGLITTIPKVNGATTLGENIADNGGLHAALKAYRKLTAKNGLEPRLPGLESYTPEQLFFIASATNWCESSTKESLLDSILSDSHSPNRFRVLGTIQNSKDFAKIFNCPKITNEKLCLVW